MSRPSQEIIVPVLATSVAVLASIHVLRKPLRKLVSLWSLQRKSVLSSSETTEVPNGGGTVMALYIHPVKSLRAVSCQEAQLDSKGFVGDRRLMIVFPLPTTATGKASSNQPATTHRFVSQRQCPSLARVTAILEKDQLILTYGTKTLQLSLPGPGVPQRTYRAGIWDDTVAVDDMGDEAASFFQAIVDEDENTAAAGGRYKGVRLVIHTVSDRLVDPNFTPAVATSWLLGTPPPVSLTDGYPVLIACQASLDELNRRLKENQKPPIDMKQFRPNIVIAGTTAFEEDRWKYITIGDQLFAIVKGCPRCKQSCTNQETGQVSSEPIETMRSFRALGDSNDVFFAQNAIPLGKTGKIKVGDSVRVLERGEPLYC